MAKGKSDIRLRIGINLGDVIVEGGDIYGDGVNLAARLEAEADPGGICVSAVVAENSANKVAHRFTDMGERQLKNLPKPIRVFQWSPGARPTAESGKWSAARDKPTIAVLPFVNMSGDPEQAYFSDGMSEDIITGLSRFRTLSVMARNSAFSLRDKDLTAAEIGARLGVQYLVEGS
ncbi:MAG: adenylate/guanylate cyclase domain-containing protein, partial [Paracoccaceae bacterium]